MRMKILIILTITLIIITTYYYGFVIYAKNDEDIAKTLVTEVNTDITNLLTYQNYVIVNNEVNINQPGIYKVIYRNIETNEEIIKDVHVIEKEKRGYFFEEKLYDSIDDDGVYEIIDVFTQSDLPNAVYTYQGPINSLKHYFVGEINENKYYSSTISLHNKGNIADAIIYNNVVYCVGTDTNIMDGSLEIKVFVKDNKGTDYYSIDIDGNVEVTSLCVNDQYFFIVGNTNETTKQFTGMRKGKDSFLIIYNRETNKIENTIMLSQENDDLVKEIIYYDGYLYLIQSNGVKSLRLMKIDIFGNIIKENNIDLIYEYHNEILKLIDNKLYLAYTKYDYDIMDYVTIINSIEKDLQIVEVFKEYNPGMKIVDFDFKNNIKFVLMNNLKNNLGYEYCVYDSNNNLLGKYKSNSDDLIVGLAATNVIVGTSNDKRSLKYYKINSVIKLNEPYTNIYFDFSDLQNYQNITSYEIMINGEFVEHHNDSYLKYNKNNFGSYDINYYFKQYFDYYIERECKVIPFVGAVSNQTYDVGLTIQGNGTLYVNNMLIDESYTFDNPGLYEIKLIGKDNNQIIYNIEISDLAVKFEENKKADKLNIENIECHNESEHQISKKFTQDLITKESKNASMFLYLIPTITLGLAILLVRKVF